MHYAQSITPNVQLAQMSNLPNFIVLLCRYGKRKLQLVDYQLTAILRSCLGRIRTLTGGTRIRRATITPQGNICCES